MIVATRLAVTAAAALALVAATACSKPEGTPPAGTTEAPPAALPTAPAPPPAAATTSGLATRLCDVMRRKAPELKGMPEVGARAQLVMAIGTAFDADAKSLATVSSDIDAIAAASCPEVRAPLLAATRAASLQEAVR